MDHRGRQLQHARLRGALRAHFDGDAYVVGKRIGKDVKLFAVDPDLLRHRIAKLLDLRTKLVGGESMAGMQGSSFPAAKKRAAFETDDFTLYRNLSP